MSITGVVITPLEPFTDERGSFAELARLSELPIGFEQVSHSHSRAGVLRGLHFHRAQSDLWYLASGEAQICLVDLRDETLGARVHAWETSAAEPCTVLIPPGVAHGYLALTDIDMLYLTSHAWDPEDEFGLAWDDPQLQIPWKISDPVLSQRDNDNPTLNWQSIPAF